MKHNKFKIGISCIGSGVGQSVINSLRLSRLPIETIGLGTNPFAYGAYDCDKFDYTLSIYEDGFIDSIIEKCHRYKIDLLIAGLDDEVMIYAQNAEKLEENGIKAIFPGLDLIKLCRDKEKMSNDLNKIVDVFVKSYNKNNLEEDIENGKIIFPFIAKPRGGFASKGIEIIRSEKDLHKINDDHIIQELAIPHKNDPNYNFYINQIEKNRNPQVSEISIQIVYNPEGKLIGRMFSYNKLNNGVPIEILPYDNEYIWNIVDRLTPVFLNIGLRGPLNIQGRLTENGLKLFEMNPRFTGITGLRALMGFNEVEACVKEWLGIDVGKNNLKINYNRFGTRQTADKSIPLDRNNQIQDLFKHLNNEKKEKRKIILITGACGYLGQNLIKRLVLDKNFIIYAFDLDKEKMKNLFIEDIENIYDLNDLNNGNLSLGKVDILLHLGFARPHLPSSMITDSLNFTFELFTRSVMNHIPEIINISSQSVYGLETAPPWSENTVISPSMIYAQAKYSTEIFLKSLKRINNQLRYTSLRLSALAGGAPGLIEIDFLSKFVRNAINHKPIEIYRGTQQMERFDIRDAVDSLITLLYSTSEYWKESYNLGSGEVYEIIDIAKKTKQIAQEFYKIEDIKILVNPKESNIKFGMDSSLFYNDMRWKPKYKIEDTIDSLFNYFINEKKHL